MRKGKTVGDLPFGWKEKMIDMGEQGCYVSEIIKGLGLTLDIHRTMLKNSDEYREAWAETNLASEAWWLRTGRENLMNNKFNNAMWIFNVKNRIGWRDQPLIPAKGTGSAFDDEREKEILLSKYQSKVDKATLQETDKIN